VGLAPRHPPSCRIDFRPVPACCWIRPAGRGPCWRLERPEADLPADRQFYPRAQELLKLGLTYLDKNGDGVACESLR